MRGLNRFASVARSYGTAWQSSPGRRPGRRPLPARRPSTTFEVLDDGSVVTDWPVSLCRQTPVGGRQIHDANIVATMLAYGERRLLTFSRTVRLVCGPNRRAAHAGAPYPRRRNHASHLAALPAASARCR